MIKKNKSLCIACLLLGHIGFYAHANQTLPITPSNPTSPKVLNQPGQNTVTINNRTFLIEPKSTAPQAMSRSTSRLMASPARPDIITKGMAIKNMATGSLATVTGRFSVLLKAGTNAQDFANRFGLKILRQLGNSRLYIFEAADHIDILAVEKDLKEAVEASSVKVELLENMMQPL